MTLPACKAAKVPKRGKLVARAIMHSMVSQVAQRMDRTLSSGHVQRLTLGRVGPREVALLQVRVPGETVHILVASGCGAGLIDEEARGRLRERMGGTAPSYQAYWRSRIEGARLAYVVDPEVAFIREGATFRVTTEDARTLALASAPPNEPPATLPWSALQAQGARITGELLRADLGSRQDELARAISKAMKRIERRIEAVRRDLARMHAAAREAERAQLFVAAAARAPRGTTTLYAVDWSSEAPEKVELVINPAKTPHEQIAAIFKRARRLKDGATIASTRLREAAEACDALRSLRGVLTDRNLDPSAVEARARAAAPRDFKLDSHAVQAPGKARRDAPRPPYRKFCGASGAAILVGRGAAQNDALTMQVARPHDLWLHAKGRTGAHVVVPLDKGASCPPDVLVEAAHLAAHFSEARDESVVDVLYTPRRYLRKPRGSPAGAVAVDQEKVIILRKSDEVMRKLLQSEAESER